jgi:hypothetical protein
MLDVRKNPRIFAHLAAGIRTLCATIQHEQIMKSVLANHNTRCGDPRFALDAKPGALSRAENSMA